MQEMQETQETWVRSLGWEDPLEEEKSIFLPGKSHDRRAWWVTVHGVINSRPQLPTKQQQQIQSQVGCPVLQGSQKQADCQSWSHEPLPAKPWEWEDVK